MNNIALDIGGSSIKYALIDDCMNIKTKGSIPCKTDCMESLLSPLKMIKNQFNGYYEGVAVSMPGKIDMANGIAITGGSFQFIRNLPMADIIKEIFEKPVIIANDGKCAANAELYDGSLKNVKSGAVIVLGTGIGGGIIIDGKVWLGNDFGAGEFSMLPTSFAEFSGFNRTVPNENQLPIWAATCSTRGLVNDYCNIKGLETCDGKEFFTAFDRKEPEALVAFNRFCEGLAIGIFSIQSIIDVEMIAIGGGISARPEVTEGIRISVNKLFDRQICCPFNTPIIVTCKYGNDANLLGALYFYKELVSK